MLNKKIGKSARKDKKQETTLWYKLKNDERRREENDENEIPVQIASTPLNIELPTTEEIIEAILQLKNNKAAGSDGISPALLNAIAELIEELIEEI